MIIPSKGPRVHGKGLPINHMLGNMSILYTVKVPNSLIKVTYESTRQMRQTEQRGREEESGQRDSKRNVPFLQTSTDKCDGSGVEKTTVTAMFRVGNTGC